MNMYLDKTQYETSLDLSLYIEGLLNTTGSELELKTTTEETIETILLNDLVVPELDAPQIRIEEKKEAEVIPAITAEKIEESKIPLWGQEPFRCLLVKSAGMKLMIPAQSVSYIEKINKKTIRLPLDVEAFRGVLTLRQRSVAVIDLFTLISENGISLNKTSTQVAEHHVEYVIVMENGAYALACDDIGEMLMLDPESVRWNKASFNNPMFAGMVTEHLCPIVNIDTVQLQVEAMPFVQSLNKNY